MALKQPAPANGTLLQLQHIDRDRLAKVWREVTGGVRLLPDMNRELQKLAESSAEIGGVKVAEICQHLAALVELLGGQQELLVRTGIDDFKYRLIVTLINAINDTQHSPNHDGRSVTQVVNETRSLEALCVYIKMHLNLRFNMDALEAMSGLSARTLQYQFKKSFGCSPMRWIMQQRLHACRERFLIADDNDSVTAIALGYGFTNLGNFARAYAHQFGELPSETLEKLRR